MRAINQDGAWSWRRGVPWGLRGGSSSAALWGLKLEALFSMVGNVQTADRGLVAIIVPLKANSRMFGMCWECQLPEEPGGPGVGVMKEIRVVPVM